MMRRLTAALVAGSLLALGMAALAIADHRVVRDPSGDVQDHPPGRKADFDLIKGSHGHGRHGRLVHTVTVRGTIGDPHTPMGAPFPLLLIDIPGQQGSNPGCDYFISGTPPSGPGGEWGAAVFRCSNGPTTKTGGARVRKVDEDRLRYSFRRHAIGSPDRYRWAFSFSGEGDVQFDRLPDHGFVTHDLR
jgi:hypothetical protein